MSLLLLFSGGPAAAEAPAGAADFVGAPLALVAEPRPLLVDEEELQLALTLLGLLER